MENRIDILWILLSSGLVFLMQAGFLCLETGLTRNKNNINVAIKNLTDFAVSSLIFWLFGYAFMFGQSAGGFIGLSNFGPSFDAASTEVLIFLVFQIMFCGTSVTILSGATAERMKFSAYLIVSLLIAGLVYPVFGHWAWNGLSTGTITGWLGAMGFVDFAGSTVVHSVGGWAALAILLIIGSRKGRFLESGEVQKVQGANIPLATLGVVLLWIGWFGFNGGSTLALNDQTVTVIANTLMSGSIGLVAALVVGSLQRKRSEVDLVINGSLAGLVAITASAHAVSLSSAFIIGGIAGVIVIYADALLVRLKIDDAVGAIPVHLLAGIWGTLAVGIFGQPDILGTGLSMLGQVGVQFVGIIAAGVWTMGITYGVLRTINAISPLRVSEEEEYIGLNVTEHGATTEILDLLTVMNNQSETGDLSQRVTEEPFTEIGQIAYQYNRLLDSLETEVERTEAIVKTSNDAIITFSQESLAILSVNPSARQLFRYSTEEFQSQSLLDLLEFKNSDGKVANVIGQFNSLIDNEKYTEMIGIHADGSHLNVEVTIKKVDSTQQPFFTATIRDIRERKQAEEKIQSQTLSLVSANRDLAVAKRRADEATHLKSQFLATMSHELRTPLNAIIGYTEIQLAGMTGPLTEEQEEYQDRVLSNAEHLLGLINDVLDISKIEAGRMDIVTRPINLKSWLDSIIQQTGVLAEEKGLELIVQIDEIMPEVIIGDATRLQQIALNLLSNAIKFTDEGQVSIQLSPSQQDTWQIIVTDTGFGIPAHQQETIFQEFRQVDGSSKRKHGGTGLGLAIVRKLALTMSGTVRVSSVLGEGSTFYVTLPLVTDNEENQLGESAV